jgi:hypothetical protein
MATTTRSSIARAKPNRDDKIEGENNLPPPSWVIIVSGVTTADGMGVVGVGLVVARLVGVGGTEVGAGVVVEKGVGVAGSGVNVGGGVTNSGVGVGVLTATIRACTGNPC